jgi:hypothetical protein
MYSLQRFEDTTTVLVFAGHKKHIVQNNVYNLAIICAKGVFGCPDTLHC